MYEGYSKSSKTNSKKYFIYENYKIIFLHSFHPIHNTSVNDVSIEKFRPEIINFSLCSLKHDAGRTAKENIIMPHFAIFFLIKILALRMVQDAFKGYKAYISKILISFLTIKSNKNGFIQNSKVKKNLCIRTKNMFFVTKILINTTRLRGVTNTRHSGLKGSYFFQNILLHKIIILTMMNFHHTAFFFSQMIRKFQLMR